MSRPFFGICLLLVWPATLCSQQIEWRPSLDAAIAEGESVGKPVLIHFSAEWCRPCDELKRFVLADTMVIRAVNQETVPVLIDTDAHPDLVKKYAVSHLPAEVVLATGDRVVLKRMSPQQPQAWLDMLALGVEAANKVKTEGGEGYDGIAALTREWEENQKPTADTPEPFQINEFHLQNSLRPARGQATSGHSPSRFSAGSSPANLATATAPAKVENHGSAKEEKSPVTIPNNNIALTEEEFVTSATIVPPTGIYANDAPATQESLPPPENVVSGVSSGPGPVIVSNPYVKSINDADRPEVSIRAIASTKSEDACSICLDGLCPVTVLAEGSWVAGNPAIGCVHRGRTYLFQSLEKRERFLSEPDRWSPLFAGFDPVSFSNEGRLVEGQRRFGIFMKADGVQQVVLFSSQENQTEFKASSKIYLDAIQRATSEADEWMANPGQ